MKKGENYTAQLKEYIKKNLKKGYTKESLRWALVNQGHSRIEVDKAIKKVEEDLAREAPILETKPDIKYEVIAEKNEETEVKKPFWKRILGID